jgi:hemerythrin-like domain-containing protein
MLYSEPIQMLVNEHEVILSVLDAVETVAQRTAADGVFPQPFYEQAVDFFATFADQCHHAKEEQLLFPLLAERGIPLEGGPIGCMLSEHDLGRQHVAAVRAALPRAAAGDAAARATVRQEALAYAELLREHIMKENQVLFVLGDQYMTDQDKAELWNKFQCAEHSNVPPGTHEKYLALAKKLRTLAGRQSEPAR